MTGQYPAAASFLLACSLTLLSPSVHAAPSPWAGPSRLAREEPAAPWKARHHQRYKHMPEMGLALVDQSAWPDEPETPASPDAGEFARAFRELSRLQLPRARAEGQARLLLDHAKEFGVDPFLLAAVAYRQSRGFFVPRGQSGGLISVDLKEHARFVRENLYHYWVLEQGKWVPRSLDVGSYSFTAKNLRKNSASAYFAAALLRVYQEQCPDIDTRFGSVPHRHPVSHLVWGDAVVDAGSEERILTDRRRLIQYYLQSSPEPVSKLGELKLYSPLDGPPRKITGGLGDMRGEGHHAHRGVDFESVRGEPVRAIADGEVFYAGVSARRLSPARATYYPSSRMGRGGLFIIIQHTPEIASAYMHLGSYVVEGGEQVKGGQLIGYVGRTGIKRDPAHLHFEIRRKQRPADPVRILGASVFPRDATFLGHAIMAAQPRAWRRVRRAKALRREEAKRQAEQASETAPGGEHGAKGETH